MRRIIMIMSVVALIFTSSQAFSQTSNKWKMQLGYNVGIPMGTLKTDFVDKTSFRGGMGEISYSFNPKFSLGLSSGFQDYYQKYDRAVYHTGSNQDVSAVLSNSMQIIPIMVKGTIMPNGDKASFIKPYVSLGAGVNLVDYQQYLGEFPNSNTSAAFAAQAGAGIMVPFNKNTNEAGIKLGATYNYSPYNKNGLSNLNTVGVNVGVVFNLK